MLRTLYRGLNPVWSMSQELRIVGQFFLADDFTCFSNCRPQQVRKRKFSAKLFLHLAQTMLGITSWSKIFHRQCSNPSTCGPNLSLMKHSLDRSRALVGTKMAHGTSNPTLLVTWRADARFEASIYPRYQTRV